MPNEEWMQDGPKEKEIVDGDDLLKEDEENHGLADEGQEGIDHAKDLSTND